jgi:hypothetical protein
MGKHKSRHQRAQEQTEQTKADDTVNIEKPKWGSWDWVKSSSSFTDWCIVVFTLALVVVGIRQFIIMGGQLRSMDGQLDVMRKDQRPLVKLTCEDFTTVVNSPISCNLHITNPGKARRTRN